MQSEHMPRHDQISVKQEGKQTSRPEARAVVTDVITKACPCNIWRFCSAVKIKKFIGFFFIFFSVLRKT